MKSIPSIMLIFLLFMPGSGFASENASKILGEARNFYKQADELQGAWISTGKLIQRAEQAIKSGNREAALKMAKKARFEAKHSLEQARDQLTNWSEPSYLK